MKPVNRQCACLDAQTLEKLERLAAARKLEVAALVREIVTNYLATESLLVEEKRRYPRVETDIRAMLSLHQSLGLAGGLDVDVRLNNISMSGANFTFPVDVGKTENLLRQGVEIDMTFSFSEKDEPICFKSEVTWVEQINGETRAGIRFGVVNIDSYMQLAERLEELQ